MIWTITAEGAGASGLFVRFESIENLFGGTGNDGFQMNGTLLGAVGLNGGGGTDTLAGPDTVNVWAVTGNGIGTLNTDTKFTSIERLIGGNDNDRFDIGASGALAFVSGGAANPARPTVNELDLADAAAPVTVNLAGGHRRRDRLDRQHQQGRRTDGRHGHAGRPDRSG